MQNYEILLNEAKELNKRWLLCPSDKERILLAKESGKIKFILDNDNTTCHFVCNSEGLTQDQSDEISESFYHQLDADLGNREGVETLLNILGIPFEHC